MDPVTNRKTDAQRRLSSALERDVSHLQLPTRESLGDLGESGVERSKRELLAEVQSQEAVDVLVQLADRMKDPASTLELLVKWSTSFSDDIDQRVQQVMEDMDRLSQKDGKFDYDYLIGSVRPALLGQESLSARTSTEGGDPSLSAMTRDEEKGLVNQKISSELSTMVAEIYEQAVPKERLHIDLRKH